MHSINHIVFDFIATNDRPLFPTIERLALAAKLRVWAKMDNAQVLYDKYIGMDDDDDLLAVPPFPEWHRDCIIGRLGKHFQKHERLFNTIKLNGRGLQGCIARALFREIRDVEAFAPLVRSRLAVLDLSSMQLASIIGNYRAASTLVPAMALTAWIKALANAWTTSRRMGAAVGSCPFCSASASDCMLHAVPCSVATGVGTELLPGLFPAGRPTPSLVALLGGCRMSDLHAAGLGLFLASVHSVLMHKRFGGSPGAAAALAEAKLRSLRLASPKTAVVIARLQQPP
jgi:hypothetical protein